MDQTLELQANDNKNTLSFQLVNNCQNIKKEIDQKNQLVSAAQKELIVSPQKSQKKKNQLNNQEVKLIAHLYSQHRSKWSLYTTRMVGKQKFDQNRNQREIKNFFYNSLRKLATKLSNIEKKKRLFQKNDLDTNMLRNLIDIEILVGKTLNKYSLSDQQMVIYRVKEDIFDNCFRDIELDQDRLLKLSKDIRKLKFMFKNLRNIQKSQVNEAQSIKFAMAVLQKQYASCDKLSIKQKIKQKQIKLQNQLKLLKIFPGKQAKEKVPFQPSQEQQQNQGNYLNLHIQTNWRVSENSCCCQQCIQFHNFQQFQYYQAMQQLHQNELLREPNRSYGQYLEQAQKFYTGYMSMFYPYLPAICKIQAQEHDQ